MAGSMDGNIIGISLAIVASVSGALGNLLFRLSWKAKKWRKWIRFGGLCTVLAADPARIGSFGFGEPAIVAPFSALSLVWLILLANPIAGDKPKLAEVVSALVIASGVVIIAVFGSGGGSSDDDEFGIDANDSTRRQLFQVIDTFNENSSKPAFKAYMFGQVVFLIAAGFVAATQPPETIAAKVSWGSLGGVLQGNVYFLKTASTMAVIDFSEACKIGTFWVYVCSFALIASSGLALNALAMRFYKATFCVCSFVGWYNVSAAISAASFFGSNLEGQGLALYLTGLGLITVGVGSLVAHSFNQALKEHGEDGGGDVVSGGDVFSDVDVVSDVVSDGVSDGVHDEDELGSGGVENGALKSGNACNGNAASPDSQLKKNGQKNAAATMNASLQPNDPVYHPPLPAATGDDAQNEDDRASSSFLPHLSASPLAHQTTMTSPLHKYEG